MATRPLHLPLRILNQSELSIVKFSHLCFFFSGRVNRSSDPWFPFLCVGNTKAEMPVHLLVVVFWQAKFERRHVCMLVIVWSCKNAENFARQNLEFLVHFRFYGVDA
jgi:hypothetical protein